MVACSLTRSHALSFRRSLPLAAPVFMAAMLAALCVTASAGAAPPRVAKCTPDNGDTDVDPKTKQIRIEFDQDMSNKGHSVCGGGPAFPEIRGKPRWAGKRVFVLNVRLQPDHEYSFSINCPAAQNFRSASGEPVESYPVTFKTGSGKSSGESKKADATANKKAVAALRDAIDKHYSYRDLRKVDWPALFKQHAKALESAESPAAFARAASKLLASAEDMHIWLDVDGVHVATYRRKVTPNVDLRTLERVVPGFKKQNDMISTGRFKDGTGYVLITTWGPKDDGDLEAAFEALADFADAKALIVDVRMNGGGSEPLAQDFAGCFVRKPAVYSKNVTRDPDAEGGFTEVRERVLSPKKGRPRFGGKVAVLMGPACVSSCESFLLMMRQAPGCKLVGARSFGSSGNPKPHELGNGVTVFLPSWKDMLPDGTLLEGKGVEPDITVEATPEQLKKDDPVIAAALKALRA